MTSAQPSLPVAADSSPLHDVLAALATTAGCQRSVVLLRDTEGPGFLIAASHGFNSEQSVQFERLAKSGAIDPNMLNWLERERRAVVLENPSVTNSPTSQINEIRPNVLAPLFTPGGELVGALGLVMQDTHPDRIRVVDALARVAGAVVLPPAPGRDSGGETRRGQVLLEMFHQMTTSVALPQVLGAICWKTVDAFGVTAATVFEVRDGREFVQAANYGISPDVAERYVRFRYTPGNVPRNPDFVSGRSVVVSRHPALPPEEREWLDALGVHAAALFPLLTGDVMHGALAVGIREKREFTPTQILDIELVAHHATTAMAFARFLRNAEVAARFRASVSALAVELNAETDRARALHLLCSRGRVVFRASWAALLLASGDRLFEVAADGDFSGVTGALVVPMADETNPAARAFRTSEVVITRPEYTDDRSSSSLAVPLVGSDGPAGVLLFHDLRDLSSTGPGIAGDAKILGALAAAVLRNLDLLSRLHNANAELRRANIMKDQLLANASHDLRTPLNVIIGYGQLALEGAFGEPPSELRGIIERMVSSACDQLTLVEDLLNLSRLELNILAVKPVNMPLKPLFEEMRFVAESLVQNRPVEAIVEDLPDGVWVIADPDRLRQILTNLLGNASKFTETGSIHLFTERDNGRVRMAVRDTGIGVAPQHHKSIFEPFCQIDEARKPSGAGLGLAIARRLTHGMNGTLTVESVPGEGSTFWLNLAAGTPPGVQPVSGSGRSSQAASSSPRPLR